jgi:hypothetical protein
MEATLFSHKLPVCGCGAHLGHYVPVELKMKYRHVQKKTLTCCCSGLRTGIQSQGSISFCDDLIRSCYRSHTLRQRGELQLQPIEVMPQGTTTRADRETPTPDAQVCSNCDSALRACRGILIQAAPTSGIAARCRTAPILRRSLPLPL